MEQWYTFEDDTKTNVKMKSRLILNINSGNADVIKTFLVTSKNMALVEIVITILKRKAPKVNLQALNYVRL